ncbi:putative ferric-chelate reductase 1 [Stegodyphus dumicola]|uniref:putative ferric-chelate reductase 1 n=1 Tax=Stegodyphus dumicola TaxID=202533 RepID=UPI0015AE0A37|nr:putative ferric-chelate reductase 1 [Stegodyphus dumicola]XP_035210062.1 putative ferric-chelate reductase 1 [Stegodyphus dumicola]
MLRALLLVSLAFIPLAAGWPTGAPSKACEAMLPKHGNNRPQPAHLSPYSFIQSTDSYRPGDQVIVYVQAPAGTPFKGMMVQAYDPRTNNTIGEFLEGVGLKKIFECASMSHSDNRDKKSATLVWVAPQDSGNVRFRATIVQQFNTFYHGLSAALQKV